MDIANLVRMANRIGDFFEAVPDRDEAVEGVAQHLGKFWDPRMRRLMLEHADQAGTAALHSLVAQAIERQRAVLL